MTLNHELIKKILLAFESSPNPYPNLKEICQFSEIKLSDNESIHHFEILLDMRLIIRSDGKNDIGVHLSIDDPSEDAISVAHRFRLTAEGHEYIGTIKKIQIWEKMKKSAGDLGLGAMREAGKYLMQEFIKRQILG